MSEHPHKTLPHYLDIEHKAVLTLEQEDELARRAKAHAQSEHEEARIRIASVLRKARAREVHERALVP